MDEESSTPDPADIARDLLAWYRAAGVEDAVGDEAIDWFARGDAAPGNGFRLASRGSQGAGGQTAPAPAGPSSARSEPTGRPTEPRVRPSLSGGATPSGSAQSPGGEASAGVRQFPTASPDEAVMAARTAAATAASLSDLKGRLEEFRGCGLKATAKNLCFFRGAERARLMLIGEAPGRDEDLSGVPFVGPAGQLLDKMLAAVGLSDETVHITNTVYWRPPGNRTPSPQETLACRPFLDRQIELVQPDVIGLLGGAAANTVLNVPGGIMKLRGTWREIEIGGRKIRVMATLHPAFLLRSPANKRQAWRDTLALIDALEGGN
jgi:DNA polymerase